MLISLYFFKPVFKHPLPFTPQGDFRVMGDAEERNDRQVKQLLVFILPASLPLLCKLKAGEPLLLICLCAHLKFNFNKQTKTKVDIF